MKESRLEKARRLNPPMNRPITSGRWHAARNEQQVDVYSHMVDDGQPLTIAIAMNLREADASAVAELPNLLKNAHAVGMLVRALLKHSPVLEFPEAASLLISDEWRELQGIVSRHYMEIK